MCGNPTYKILIVDDNYEDRLTFCRYLHQSRRYNYQILEAESVSEALEICDRTPPDLILLDYLLPDDNGLVFLKEWQRRYGSSVIPVMMLTGQGDEKIAVEAIKLGAQDYCIKGKLSAGELRKVVYTVLQQLQLKRQIARQQEQQTLVNSIALRIRQSLHLEEVLQTTVAEIRQFLQADRVLIYKFNPDMSGAIAAEAVLPQYMACLNRQIEDSCFIQEGYVEPYRQGRVFAASDIQTAGIADRDRKLLESFEVKANLVVPIVLNKIAPELSGSASASGNQPYLWGLSIAHQCDRPRQWQDYEIDLLQQLALQLAIAIQQAQMYERVQTELVTRIEGELREKQRVAAEFRALVENATDIILRFDRDLRYLYLNPAIEKLVHQRASSLIGKTPHDLGVSPEIIALWRASVDRTIVTKLEETIECPFPDFNSPIWFDIRIVPELNQAGEVDTFLCIARDISDRKRNEKTLLFQAEILDRIHDGVISTDPNGIIQSWNQGAEKLHGYTAAEAIGQPITMLCFPEEVRRMESLVFPPLLEKGNHEVEVRNRTKSGAEIFVSLRLSLIRDKEGNIIRLIGCSNDITERKRNEETLLFQAEILERIHDAVIVTGVDGTIYSWNQGAEKLYGYSAAEAIGQNFTMLYLPEYLPQVQSLVIQPLLAKGNHEIELHKKNKSDTTIFVALRLSLIRDEQGNIIRLIGCSNDITERKKAEQELQQLNQELETRVEQRTTELQQSQRFIQSVTDNIPNIIYIYDLQEQRNIYSNREVGSILGYSPEQILAMESSFITDFTHSDDLENLFAHLGNLENIKDGERRNCEYRMRDVKGQWHWFLSRDAVFLRDRNGKVKQIIGTAQDITERKQIEDQLRKSETNLRIAQRIAGLGSWEFDLQTQQIVWSDEIFAIFGRNPEIGTPTYKELQQIVHPEDRDRHNKVVQWAIEQGEPYDIEYRLYRPDGTLRYLQGRGEPIFNSEDEVVRLVGTALDITERKQYEAKLSNLSERLSLAIKSGKFGIWEWDIVQNRLIWDDRMYELYGLQRSISLEAYQTWQQGLHPDDRVQAETAIQQALQGEREFTPEFRVIHPDGSIRYIKAYALVQRNGRGEPQRMVGINFDITSAKQAEEQLRNLSDRLSLAIESGGFGIWEWNIVQDRLIWDDRMYELYGQQRSDRPQTYQMWITQLHPDDREQAEAIAQQALRDEREYTSEFRVIHPDGSLRHIKAYALVQRNERGEPQRMVGLNFDITSSKQTEEQLRRINERLTLTNAELDRATKLKDEFLANMSHELRTPLNAILGMTEGLQDGVFGNLSDRQKQAVNSIDRSGNHLLTLINDILDLAKVESGKLELQLAPTSISYLCGNSLIFVRQQAVKKNIQLITEIPSGLPDIVVDELRIRQVLINLLSNAVKFTPDGGIVKLVVKPVRTSDNILLHFSIVDTGIGMTSEDAAKLFQPFVQIDSRLNRQYSGTGLGLALVRRLVELHQGKVEVKSALGEGSCFTVRLPYVVSEPKKVQAPISQTKNIANEELQRSESNPISNIFPTEASSSTILLVEDNELNIATISSYLSSKGYILLVAKNGEDGIRIAKLEQPDLILMDIQLPKIDGLEAIRQIRADEELTNIPIIALTALAMPGDREKCLVAGANDYMSKPVKLKQLVGDIQRLLKKG